MTQSPQRFVSRLALLVTVIAVTVLHAARADAAPNAMAVSATEITQENRSYNCNPAVTAMVLQSLQAEGLLPTDPAIKTDYSSVRDTMRRVSKTVGQDYEVGVGFEWNDKVVQELTKQLVSAKVSWADFNNPLGDLEAILRDRRPVQVYFPGAGDLGYATGRIWGAHTVVVIGITDSSVTYVDPWPGAKTDATWSGQTRTITREAFLNLWRRPNQLPGETHYYLNYEVKSPAPPSAPENLTVTTLSTGEIQVAWRDRSNNETGFEVSDGRGSTPVRLGPGVETWTSSGFGAVMSKCYQVRAVGPGGESSWVGPACASPGAVTPSPAASPTRVPTVTPTPVRSATAGATPTRAPTLPATATVAATPTKAATTLPSTPVMTVPFAPSDFVASAISTSEIRLTWADNSNNEQGFEITPRNGGTKVVTGPGVTSWSITGLPSGTERCFEIAAFNAAGASSSRPSACATTQTPTYAFTATLEGFTPGSISWNSNGDLTLCYHLSPENVPFTLDVTRASDDLRLAGANDNGIGGGDCIDISAAIREMFPSTCTAEILVGAFLNGSYRGGRLRFTINKMNCAQQPSCQAATQLPSIPGNFQAAAAGAGSVRLTWSDTANNECGFHVYASSNGLDFYEVATAPANTTSYTVSGLATGLQWCFILTSFNGAGDGWRDGYGFAGIPCVTL